MTEIQGKVALVTGGSRGIGAATVRALSAAKADVVVHYHRNRARAEAVVREVGPERCLLVPAALENPPAARALWNEAVTWRGHLDVLINNAGIFEPVGIAEDAETWRQAWQRTLQINLLAAAELCRAAVTHFQDRGGGIIINIASRAAFRGDTPDYMHYAASKAGLVALTRSIARGFAAEGVLAYVIAPGFVRTEMTDDFFARQGEDAVLGEIPLGEIAAPEDVANVAAFLASGRARHATGATFDINGASYVR